MGLLIRGVLGLEFDSREVRAVELRGWPGRARVEACGRVELPAGAVIEGAVIDRESAADAVKRLLREAGMRSHTVVLGVANKGVLVRFATFPRVEHRKLPGLIRYQAGEILPIPLSELVLDYAVLGENSSGHLEVLLVGARQDMLEGFLSVLEEVGLSALDIDIAPLALLQLREMLPEHSRLALLHIANGLSSLLVVEKGVPRLARLISRGLQDALGFMLADPVRTEAAAASDTPGLLQNWCADLAREVQASLGYYQSQSGNEPLEMVILTGPGARLGDLGRQLQEMSGLNVRVPTGPEGFVLSPRLEGRRAELAT
ncbi:MAG: type IV pilus biogenesis protein PilM, partial [Bacillota bacterium]